MKLNIDNNITDTKSTEIDETVNDNNNETVESDKSINNNIDNNTTNTKSTKTDESINSENNISEETVKAVDELLSGVIKQDNKEYGKNSHFINIK